MDQQGHRERGVTVHAKEFRDLDRGQLKRPDVARCRRNDRGQGHAAGKQRCLEEAQLDPDRLTAGHERGDGGGPRDGTESKGSSDRPWTASDGQAIAQPSGKLHDLRVALCQGRDPIRERQSMADVGDGQGRHEQSDEHCPKTDGRAHDATDAERHDRDRRQGHDDHGVDDALHHDRAEDRWAAHALALAQRVTADELAKTGRQDVVGEVTQVRIAQDAAVRDALDRREQDPPPTAARGHVDQ